MSSSNKINLERDFSAGVYQESGDTISHVVIVNCCPSIQCVMGGEGLGQINTCRIVPSQVKFFK
jgi:hypothetical protein